jgi:hypothetical protein
VRRAVHERLGDRLRHSAAVGLTHADGAASRADDRALPGSAPVSFSRRTGSAHARVSGVKPGSTLASARPGDPSSSGATSGSRSSTPTDRQVSKRSTVRSSTAGSPRQPGTSRRSRRLVAFR